MSPARPIRTPETDREPSTVLTARHRSRRSATDEKIAAGVFEVLRDRGLGGLTIDAVSAESGVAKTTIYRRYADRYEMLAGVSKDLTLAEREHYSPTADGLTQLLQDIHTIFERYGGSRAINGLLVGRRTEIETLRTALVDTNVDRVRQLFRDGVAAGTVETDVDIEQMVELLIGGVVFVAATRGSVTPDWIAATVALIWPAIAADA